jgi:putative transposase
MNPDKELCRRSIRIAGADYTEPGAYFITICAAYRQNTFGRIENGRVVLSGLGAIVRTCWVQIPEHFPAATIKDFVVMPNHLHGIVAISVGARYIVPSDPKAHTPEKFQKPIRGSIPTIVRTFKAAVSRNARKKLSIGGDRIWQSNYFERVLRDGEEYAKASRYILENPARWEWDRENLERKIEPGGDGRKGR